LLNGLAQIPRTSSAFQSTGSRECRRGRISQEYRRWGTPRRCVAQIVICCSPRHRLDDPPATPASRPRSLDGAVAPRPVLDTRLIVEVRGGGRRRGVCGAPSVRRTGRLGRERSAGAVPQTRTAPPATSRVIPLIHEE
jgi:hypothetical protein